MQDSAQAKHIAASGPALFPTSRSLSCYLVVSGMGDPYFRCCLYRPVGALRSPGIGEGREYTDCGNAILLPSENCHSNLPLTAFCPTSVVGYINVGLVESYMYTCDVMFKVTTHCKVF